MSLYKFKISDKAGKTSEILLEADSQADATRRLQRRGVIPLAFLGEGSLSASGKGGFGFGQRFDILDFTDRLVPLIEAEIPLERALGIVGEGMENKFTARIVADLRRGLHEGRKFSELIRDRGHLFPRIFASVVEAGEEAGALAKVMAELRRFLNDSREFRSFLISSAIYPLFVLTASMVMVVILLGVIVPRFATVLAGMGRELPLSTRMLLTLSNWFRDFWWCVPVLLATFIILALQVRKEGKVRAVYDKMILSVPLIGKMVLLSNLARMSRTMAILMRSGVHLLDTVWISIRIIENSTLSQSISGLAGELRQGQRLSHAFGHSHFIPQFMLRMLAVGEETGSVETMLERVADRYETDLKRMSKRILSLFEPMVIIALGLFVALVVLAMFTAIMDMQGGF